MAAAGQLPGKELFELYHRWSRGGVGTIITGNVMVHAEALTGPAGVVLDAQSPIGPFREWADAAQGGGAKVWMQINHPGKQCPRGLNKETISASAVPFKKELQSAFATPREMTHEEILEVMRDLREHNVDMLTIGQYLMPTGDHLPVRRYVHPDTFKMFEEKAAEMGFVHAAVGAMVRSSYHADLQARGAGLET